MSTLSLSTTSAAPIESDPPTASSVVAPSIATPAPMDTGRVSSSLATRLSISSKRMLQDAQINESRPEILAVLDFKPLYATGGDLTIAGKMFEARVGERTQTLETIKTLLVDLEANLPDEYAAALNQYSSSLAATEADLALLKLMILLREYATHTARFLDFVDEYEPSDVTSMNIWGTNTAKQLEEILGMREDESRGGSLDFWEYASKPLVQIMCDISFCTYGLMPGLMASRKRTSNEIAEKFKSADREELPLMCLNYSLRDMVASHEFVKLREGDEVDDVFEALVNDVLGSTFVKSGNKQSWTAFKNLAGIDKWSRMRTSTDIENIGLDGQSNVTLALTLMAKNGVLNKMQIKYDRDKILIPETADKSIKGKEYLTIAPIVEAAFSGNPPLDFTEFNTTIEEFTKSLTDLEAFGKTLCRIGEKSEEAGLSPQGFALVGDDPPFNLGSGAAAVLDVWKRRFLDIFYESTYTKFTEHKSQEQVNYNRMIAWIMIRDDWETCYGLLSGFYTDYKDGFLTAAGIPEETDILDSDGEPTGETEWAATSYVLPGTTTPANVSTLTPRLGRKIASLEEWFQRLPHLTCTVTSTDDWLIQQGGSADKYPWLERYQFAESGEVGNGDLRPINPMFRHVCGAYAGTTKDSGNFKKAWFGSKIVAAEVVGAILEIFRMLMAPISEVEPVEDGDPIWPSLTAVKSPYSQELGGIWAYNDEMYAGFAMSSWIPTIEKWEELFTRSISKETYFRNGSFRDHAKNILRCLSSLMQPIQAPQLRHTQKSWDTTTNNVKWDLVGLAVDENTGFSQPYYTDYFENLGTIVENILNSTWNDLRGLEAPDVGFLTGARQGVGISNVASFTGAQGYETLHEETKEFMLRARMNDVGLEFLYDVIGKYAERITNYNAAVQGLVAGEDSSLGTFVESILDAGDDGVDILQNITPIQMSLKQIALQEEIGDEENAYLPTAAIINEQEVKAVQTLCREPKAISPEGDNSKIVVVGLPAGMFEKLEIIDRPFWAAQFAIRISYVDIEYPQLVFHGKTYPFHRDVYLKPDGLESGTTYGAPSFENLVQNAKFTKLSVEIEESRDMSASITINDEESTKTTDPSQWRFTSYSNLAASEVIKMYCRIMLGMNFSESAFLGTSEGIKIPVNDYAADLAASMADGLNTLGDFSENLASGATDIIDDLSTLSGDSFVSGEISPVDESLLTSLRDAFQTRLFSSETMRSRVLSAKMFDRVFALVVDPDEFYIVAPDDTDVSGVTTPQNILDFYLQKGIIEETGQDAPFRYKLAPRTTGEGKMAFGKFFVSVVSTPTNQDRILK